MLSLILLVLTAFATAQAVIALRQPDKYPELALMAAILLIALSLVVLDMTAGMLAGSGS
jgi:hypothetical protein